MRVLIAARLSRKQAHGKDGLGLDTQDEHSREFCDREGHELVAVTRDTISGSKPPMDRRELGQWVRDPARLAMYDAIVTYKTDRLSRGIDVDWSRIETWAADNGKRLIVVGPDGGIQYPSRHDSDYWQWSALKRQAGNELKDIKERTARAKASMRASGAFTDGNIPFGYVTAGERYRKHLAPTEEGRAIVPELFRRVTGGDSLADAAGWLSGETGRTWWASSVGRIIRNPVYMGYLTDRSGKIVHKCPALVDAGVFKAAGEALDGRPKRGPAVAEGRAMLTGGVFCGEAGCTAGGEGGSPMYRILCPTRRDGQPVKIAYYRCAGTGAKRKGCGNMVRLETADAGMEALALAWFTQPEMRTRIERGHDHAAELAALDYELDALRARRLPRAAERAERDRLEGEYDRVAALPAVPDRLVTEPTGRLYADLWDAVPASERGAWLKEKGLTVCATKEAIWLREDSPAVLSCARVNYSEESHRFSVGDWTRPIHRYRSEAA